MDDKNVTRDVDDGSVTSDSAPSDKEHSGASLSRRSFVRKSGKALYLAPTLTLLGSGPVSAQLDSEPPPPPNGMLAAPEAPAPSE